MHSAVQGRIRVRIPALYRSDSVKSAIEANLAGRPHILGIRANMLTGTVLVTFATGLQPEEVRSLLELAAVALPINSDPPAPAEKHPWHTLEAGSAVAHFETSPERGLSDSEAVSRLRRHGPNRLPAPVPRSPFAILLGQFKSLPVLLLGASAALSLATGGIADALAILGVVLINAGIGFVTESQAERTINALGSIRLPLATVLREGRVMQVLPEAIALGDIVAVTPGTVIPADGRLVATKNLTVDESALTGESLPSGKAADWVGGIEVPLADRMNMVYMGTLVTGGSGLAIIVATGRNTEIGIIQALVGETRAPETPMQKQLGKLGNQMVLLSVAICVAVLFIGVARGYGLLQMLKSAVSLAVAAVPEGLPTVATTTLALGIRNMRKKNVLIRHLDAVETLGAVQVICLDKTGTLTVSHMTVLALHADMTRTGCEPGMTINPALLKLLHVAVLCNETRLKRTEGTYVLDGSATENALIEMALMSGLDVNELRVRHPLIKTEYRAEGRNYMTTWHEMGQDMDFSATKGSPEEVLARCSWVLLGGRRIPLSGKAREVILQENEKMAGKALRVLGFAYAEKSDEGLTWLGLAGLADPLRQGTRELIGLFHQAGIRTVMITGDQSATAYAIGKELDLAGGRHIEILDSGHLEKLDPEVLASLVQKVEIFSRVSPAHKLDIVQALQQGGSVVAMTGDGINDGPALKAADVGVAMGTTGTAAARQIADVVLEDDNLQTMIVAVGQGRTIYNNIRKSVHFLMSTNMTEILVMLSSIGAGLGQPLNPMQLLWINLMSDVFPALALAVEPPESDILRRPPRDPKMPIIRPQDFRRYGLESLLITGGAMAAYGYGMAAYGPGARANTIAFMSLTSAQLLHAYSCRSERLGLFSRERLPKNPYIDIALGGSLALQSSTVLVPGLRSLLGSMPLGFPDALVIGAAACAPFFINEAAKRPLVRQPVLPVVPMVGE